MTNVCMKSNANKRLRKMLNRQAFAQESTGMFFYV